MPDTPSKSQLPAKRPRWTVPHLIKWILLILLLLLLVIQLWSGEYARLVDGVRIAWVVLVLKLLLIAVLIWLMRVQMSLKCELLEPKACASTEYDPGLGAVVIVVRGTASGGVFSSYTLSLELSGTPQSIPIHYPGSGSAGLVPVNNGELGRLDATTLIPTTGYQLILTVHGFASATRVCTSSFDVQRRLAYIDEIGDVTAQDVGAHPSDPSEALKWIKETPDDQPASVGRDVSIVGGADVFGCNRQMSEWALQYRLIDPTSDPWQADAAGTWEDIYVLPIWNTDLDHPRYYQGYNWMPIGNFVENGDLTRKWTTRTKVHWYSPRIESPQRVTDDEDWHTHSVDLNGPYTVRLRVKHDPMGAGATEEIYDAANVWIDNRTILCEITRLELTGGVPLEDCAELRLSQFVSGTSATTLDIIGRAWDPLIRDAPYPPTRPNDNFGYYNLKFQRDGGAHTTGVADWVPIVTGVTTPVPGVRQVSPPTSPDDGVLHSWDIVAALDAGHKKPGDPDQAEYPKIYREESCAYIIHLYVTDTTWINDASDHHDREDEWAVCIYNDLPKSYPEPSS